MKRVDPKLERIEQLQRWQARIDRTGTRGVRFAPGLSETGEEAAGDSDGGAPEADDGTRLLT